MAVTQYRLEEVLGPYSILSLRPITGRTHQLRVHCLHYGLPILGDPQYATAQSAACSRELGLSFQQLAAKKLVFPHPLTAEVLEICSKQTVLRPNF